LRSRASACDGEKHRRAWVTRPAQP
jgi:hypothetical protein